LGAPFEPHDRPLYERFEAKARVQLGQTAFEAALLQGYEMPPEEIRLLITRRSGPGEARSGLTS
jgi:hypothetical protein